MDNRTSEVFFYKIVVHTLRGGVSKAGEMLSLAPKAAASCLAGVRSSKPEVSPLGPEPTTHSISGEEGEPPDDASAAAAASLPGAPQLGAVSAAPPPAPVGLPTVSPSVSALSGNSESGNNNLQTDTPPHTPPTGGAGASQSKASALFYNGVAAASLQNGFGSSPGAGSSSASNSSSRNQ